MTEQEEFNRKQIDYMKNMIYDLQIEREGTYKSFSWKITSPLRGIKKIGKNVYKVFIDKKYRVSVNSLKYSNIPFSCLLFFSIASISGSFKYFFFIQCFHF